MTPFLLSAPKKVRNLCIIIDSDLNFNNYVKSITKSAYYNQKNIARLQGCMSTQELEKLIHAFTSSRLDYCNDLFSGLSKKALRQLQLIQSAAARVLTKTNKAKHITVILRSLRWQSVIELTLSCCWLSINHFMSLGLNTFLTCFFHMNPQALRSSRTGQITVPRVRIKHGEAAFCYFAVHG